MRPLQVLILSVLQYNRSDTVLSPLRFDIFTPAAVKMPEYMRSQNYQNPTQSTNSAFAYATGSEFWTHLDKTPTHSHIFNDFMATRRQGRKSWYDIYPVSHELSSLSSADTGSKEEGKVLLVDVGGNRGHDLVELRARNPELSGKMIVQDLPDVVAHASFNPDENLVIEAMPHDFFQPQPIRRKWSFPIYPSFLFPPVTTPAKCFGSF